MTVSPSIKKRSPGDQLVRRKGKLFRINKRKLRNKGRQGK